MNKFLTDAYVSLDIICSFYDMTITMLDVKFSLHLLIYAWSSMHEYENQKHFK